MKKMGCLFLAIIVNCLFVISKLNGLEQTDLFALLEEFRAQEIGEKFFEEICKQKKVGESVENYILREKAGEFTSYFQAIWDDVEYFPIPEFTNRSDMKVSYVNSWLAERKYGGKRQHEGTDIMAAKNERGLYPIVSMTNGVVTNKGWLEKGGYRIGITAPNGAYFYYAHLDSYSDIEIGDQVDAGDLLGFMGDSGYGEEGTVGQFAVHLHLGIYVYFDGKEVSVNPYWVLRYIENRRVKCYTEV